VAVELVLKTNVKSGRIFSIYGNIGGKIGKKVYKKGRFLLKNISILLSLQQ